MDHLLLSGRLAGDPVLHVTAVGVPIASATIRLSKPVAGLGERIELLARGSIAVDLARHGTTRMALTILGRPRTIGTRTLVEVESLLRLGAR